MSFAGLLLSKLLLDTDHIVRTGRIEGDSLCYVVLALNDLAPDRVNSRTGKWGQTRKLRERTESAVRQRFNIACDARICGCTPVILYRPQCNVFREGEVEGIAVRMGSVGLFAHVSVASRDMVLSSGVSLLRHSYLCWNACKMCGGVTLTPNDRSLAIRKWLNNFIAA